MGDVYDDFAADLRRRRAAQVSTAMDLDPREPDAVAAHSAAAKELGVPAVTLDSDPQVYRAQVDKKRRREALEIAPELARWLQDDPEGAALAKDDLGPLSGLVNPLRAVADVSVALDERNVGGAAERAIERGLRAVERIPPALSAASAADDLAIIGLGDKTEEEIFNILAPEKDRAALPASAVMDALLRARMIYRRAQNLKGRKDEVLAAGAESLRRAGQLTAIMEGKPNSEAAEAFEAAVFPEGFEGDWKAQLQLVADAAIDDPIGAAAFLAETAAEFVPVLVAASATTAATRSPGTGIGVMAGGSGLLEMSSSGMEFLSEQGVDVSTPEAARAALENEELMAAARERGLSRAVPIAIMDALSGGLAGKVLSRVPVVDLALQGAAQAGMGGGGELLAQISAGQDVDAREVLLEGMAELVTAPIEAAGVAGRGLGADARAATGAATATTLLKQVDEGVQSSALAERAPEVFDRFMDAMGHGDQILHVSASELMTYFQARDLGPEDWGIDPAAMDDAALSGGTVSIPLTTYASKISGTEDAAWVHDNATLDAATMTAAEARRFNEGVRDALDAAREEQDFLEQQEAAAKSSEAQVYDDVFSQLRSAGRTPDVAQQEAAVWSAFFRAMAERYGDDALDLYRQYSVRFERGDIPAPPRRRDQFDVALNSLRKGAKDPAPPPSAMSRIIEWGGISDEGGDVAGMDPPKGVVAETAKQVAERRNSPTLPGAMPAGRKGMGLDDAAAKLVEAGYLPEGAGPNDVLSALSEEMAGRPLYAVGDEVDTTFADLARDLDRAGLSVHEMTNDEIVAALEAQEGRALFQDGAADAPRGSVTFPAEGPASGQSVVKLFDGADLSTLLHESGHFFLEVFRDLASRPDAPEAMREDLAAIHDWLGAKPGEQFTVEAHEKWARGFEAYAMEGKAPSLELMDAFARFKAWLLRIYRTVRNLNVRLTPEVREVFDRMLATEEQIKLARDTAGMSPLFRDEGAAGMSKPAWDAYQRMARRATEQAEQTLLERTMAKVRREREKWFREEKANVTKEVADSMAKERQYRLIELMANRNWVGGGIEEVPDMRLDRDELVAIYGKGVLDEISRSRLGGKRAIYAKDGASLESAAELFGFGSVDEMISTLQNTPKMADAVAAEVDRVLTERHGDPLSDGSIEEEALAAIHSEQQANLVASEARTLAKRAGKPSENITGKVFRARAKAMLGRMAVRDAIRPASYLAAERRARKGAEEAFARVVAAELNPDPKQKGKAKDALAAAMRFKEQELLNHMLYMEARDAEIEVTRARKRMRDYEKKSVRAALAGDYIEQIDALLEAFDFRVVSQKKLDRRVSLLAYVEKMKAAGREAELAIDGRLLDEAARQHYTRMSLDEFRGLMDTIKSIDHNGRSKNKLIEAQRQREHDAVVAEVLKSFADNVKGEPPSRGSETKGERSKRTFRDYLNWTLNADTLLREIDGFEDMGGAWRGLKEGIDAAQSRLVDRRRTLAEDLDRLFKVYTRKEQADMGRRRHVAALGGAFTKWDMIAMALNTGNEQNFERLTNPNGKGTFTPTQVRNAMDEVMDSRDWQFVQSMWDYIESYWPEIEAKERRQTGTAPKKVAPKPMAPGPGVTGGYYPIKYDGRISGLVDDMAQKDIAEATMGGRFGKAQTANGHIKARAENTRMPVKLDIGVAFSHLQDVVHDIELSEAVAASWRVLQDPRVREAFIQKGKASDFEALELWLQDTAAGDRIAARGGWQYVRHIRTGFTFSRLALNVSTALIQPSGLAQSMVVIGKKEVATGTLKYLRNPARWTNDVVSVSQTMRDRQLTFERDVYNIVGDLESGPVTGRWGRFQRDVLVPVSFWLMKKVQFYAVDMPTWVSAYEKEIASSGDEAKARTYADFAVERAQGSGIMSNRGMLERGTTGRDLRQHEAPKLFTALASYMFAKFNVAYERVGSTNYRSPLSVLNLAADLALLFTFEALAYSLVKGGLPDDDEDDAAGWGLWLAEQTVLSAMATLPGTREISSALSGFGGGGILGSAFEGVASPVTQAAQGEFDKALVKSVVGFGGVVFHLPSSQMNVALDALFDERLEVRDDTLPIEYLMRREQ